MSAVLGLDFGTTYTSAVIIKDASLQAEPVLLEAPQEAIASAAYASLVADDGEIHWVFGSKALNLGLSYPQQLVEDIKRNVVSPEPLLIFQSSVLYSTVALKFLRHVFRRCLDTCSDIGHIVLTVPARFDTNHTGLLRTLTLRAAAEEGLCDASVELIAEPIAAAVAYNVYHTPDRHQLVYDWGGGTFDVTILRHSSSDLVEQQRLQELATHGDPKLGGRDIDERVEKFVQAELNTNCAVDLQSLNENESLALRGRVRNESRRMKEELSQSPVSTKEIYIGGTFIDKHRVSLDLGTFEEMVRAFVDRTLDCVEEALQSANLARSDIDRVLLVGGSSNIPLVARSLTERFKFRVEPFRNLDPGRAVALGAAIYGASRHFAGDLGDEVSIKIDRIAGTYLGLLTRRGMQMRFKSIFPRDRPLPATERAYFCVEGGQAVLELRIAEADADDVPASQCRVIEGVTLQLDDRLEARDIELEFLLDEERILTLALNCNHVEITRQRIQL